MVHVRSRRPAHRPGKVRCVASVAHSWEITLLRRPPGESKARVAGRLVVKAADAAEARRHAQAALEQRAEGQGRWSLGVLRPLSPQAPGTSLYRVTFATWRAEADRFVRDDVQRLEVWAEDAAGARRIAQLEIQKIPGYDPAWRIREVARPERTAPKQRRRPRP